MIGYAQSSQRKGRLEGKVALVTGAASGIGLATTRLFCREGARVQLTDIRGAQVTAAAEDLALTGAEAVAAAHDVTAEEGWREVLQQVEQTFGRVDVVVNSAGITLAKSIEETSLADWRRVMDINLTGTFLGTKLAIERMKHSGGGSIVNISSVEGIVGNPFLAAYNASKGGVRLLSKSAALHCARHGYGIRVNSVHPGYIATPMVDDEVGRAPRPEVVRQRLINAHPLGQLGTAEEIAAGILFLASDEAAFVTGSELVIDGGYTAQ